MSETKYDKRAKNIRYQYDKGGFKKSRWEQLPEKEKDYWRARVVQWDQDGDEQSSIKKKEA